MDVETIHATKTCSKCHEKKPADRANFSANERGKFGLNSICKPCKATARRELRHARRAPPYFSCCVCAAVTQRLSSKQKRCKPCQAQYRAEYWRAHRRRPEQRVRIAEWTRNYRDRNRDKVADTFWVWSQKNKERLREQRRQYRAANPDTVKHQRRMRRKREQAAGGSYTVEQFVALCQKQDWRCTYCEEFVGREKMTADHKMPLVRGGRNDIENIAPACQRCNNRKYDRTPEEFAELLKRREGLMPTQRAYREALHITEVAPLDRNNLRFTAVRSV